MRRAASQLISTLVLLSAVACAQERGVAPKRVLVLDWDDRSPADGKFEAELESALRPIAPAVEYYSESLESDRFPGVDQSSALRDYLKRKYAGRAIDV